jgi:hypothetical protein
MRPDASRMKPMQVDPDDDGRTREDVDGEKAFTRRGYLGAGPGGLGQ